MMSSLTLYPSNPRHRAVPSLAIQAAVSPAPMRLDGKQLLLLLVRAGRRDRLASGADGADGRTTRRPSPDAGRRVAGGRSGQSLSTHFPAAHAGDEADDNG